MAVSIFLTVFLSSFNSQTLPRYDLLTLGVKLLPQGWAFFTKNPRDCITEAYNQNYENLVKPNFSIEYYFGLSRIPRRVSLEIGAAVSNIPDNYWYSSVDSKRIQTDSLRYFNKKSLLKDPYLYGKIIIKNKERMPWAWASKKQKFSLPYSYTKIILK